ncbi:MAG: hypothetical protein MZU79_01870 [Anaerotruncus sp.]|nr:hypothetical protein [Anaerotruncus sp.]
MFHRLDGSGLNCSRPPGGSSVAQDRLPDGRRALPLRHDPALEPRLH